MLWYNMKRKRYWIASGEKPSQWREMTGLLADILIMCTFWHVAGVTVIASRRRSNPEKTHNSMIVLEEVIQLDCFGRRALVMTWNERIASRHFHDVYIMTCSLHSVIACQRRSNPKRYRATEFILNQGFYIQKMKDLKLYITNKTEWDYTTDFIYLSDNSEIN